MCYAFSQRSTYLRHNMHLIPIVLRKYAFVLLNFHHYVCFIFKTSNTVLPPIQMLTGMLYAGPTGRTSWVFLPLFTYPYKGVVWTLTSLPPSTSIHQGFSSMKSLYWARPNCQHGENNIILLTHQAHSNTGTGPIKYNSASSKR